MALFLKTDKDPDRKALRVNAGFRRKDGVVFLVLTRMPPHYPKPPTFVVELSSDPITLRSGERSAVYRKAYAYQDFTPKELKFLMDAEPGKVRLPLFAAGFGTVKRALGAVFERLSDAELTALVESEPPWKLVGGQR